MPRWPWWPISPPFPLTDSHTQKCLCGDTAQQVWFLAWVPFSLAHGHSLFYSNWILYPSGANLMDNTAMTLLGVIAAPVTVLFGPVAAYNLVLRPDSPCPRWPCSSWSGAWCAGGRRR